MHSQDWPFQFFTAGFGPHGWSWRWPEGERPRDQGDTLRVAILRLVKERPRTRPEILSALEERVGPAASAATVYPTLQLLEDLDHVRVAESEGKRVYHITPAGEAFLEQRREPREDVFEWLRGAGGTLAELGQAVARLASATYRQASRSDQVGKRVIEILRRAADEIEQLR